MLGVGATRGKIQVHFSEIESLAKILSVGAPPNFEFDETCFLASKFAAKDLELSGSPNEIDGTAHDYFSETSRSATASQFTFTVSRMGESCSESFRLGEKVASGDLFEMWIVVISNTKSTGFLEAALKARAAGVPQFLINNATFRESHVTLTAVFHVGKGQYCSNPLTASHIDEVQPQIFQFFFFWIFCNFFVFCRNRLMASWLVLLSSGPTRLLCFR